MRPVRSRLNPALNRRLLLALFFTSGFCSLVYQVVWTRLAFASFGIVTPVLSVVISVFMLGLSLGAWLGGRAAKRLLSPGARSPIMIYGLAELLIGLGAFAVPILFDLGARLLLSAGQMNSISYLLLSAVAITVAILPWCVCMGATFPLMMAYVREQDPAETKSFSYLYAANVLGATCGILLTAFVLIELLGFRRTLWITAAGNFAIAAISAHLGWRKQVAAHLAAATEHCAGAPFKRRLDHGLRERAVPIVLFGTGFVSLALEVVWIRAFTPVVKTQVYSFALVVGSYLLATFLGSALYRFHSQRGKHWRAATLLAILCPAGLLPVIADDVHLVQADWGPDPHTGSVIFLLLSIWPFCALLGYVTPKLVDEFTGGAPAGAGRAYAINVLGCILGPLFASYALLPRVNERAAMILLLLLLFVLSISLDRMPVSKERLGLRLVTGALAAFALFVSQSFEDYLAGSSQRFEVRRDYAASVVSFEVEKRKHLLVNGIGMTALTPITKFMVHLPAAFHQGRPESALIICFGMGTSYRSALSWGMKTTAVELVPGVKDAMAFYHSNAAQLIASGQGRIVIDDGRRFLNRTREQFDIIVIDPPPPVEAAGSSLLYSKEFYEAGKRRLKPGGVLQAWYPTGSQNTFQAVLRSVSESFPNVRCFRSVENWGIHILASMQPLRAANAADLAAQLPPGARADLLEWSVSPTAEHYLGQVLSQEIPVEKTLAAGTAARITDDLPFNEYFLLRRLKTTEAR
ncbi:MAG: hypothetical protein C5B50_12600 [Verrucomicrobia bacterium]|nr:MAG: hypothetical protein C5B50_12600 [Verrucomicrobiota bacterium]